MNKILKISITTVLFVGYQITLLCQHWEGNFLESIPNEMLIGAYKEGLNIQLEVDSITRKAGIEQNQLMDQIKFAIDNSGWKYEPTSKYIIEIHVSSLKEVTNNRQQVKIEIEHFLDEFPIQRTIDIQKGENLFLSSTLYQLINNFCVKAKMQLLNERSRKIRPAPKPNNQLLKSILEIDRDIAIEN